MTKAKTKAVAEATGEKQKGQAVKKKKKDKVKEKKQKDEEIVLYAREDLDLGREVFPIAHYMKDRRGMIEQIFSIVSGARLQAMLPPILKPLPPDELQQMCLQELSRLSRKKVQAILAGFELGAGLSSDSESETSDDSEGSTERVPAKKKKKSRPPLKEGKSDKRKKTLKDKDEEESEEAGKEKGTKTLMELLELEMRARAIKSLLGEDENPEEPQKVSEDERENLESKITAKTQELESEEEAIVAKTKKIQEQPVEESSEEEAGELKSGNPEKGVVIWVSKDKEEKKKRKRKEREKLKDKSEKKKKSHRQYRKREDIRLSTPSLTSDEEEMNKLERREPQKEMEVENVESEEGEFSSGEGHQAAKEKRIVSPQGSDISSRQLSVNSSDKTHDSNPEDYDFALGSPLGEEKEIASSAEPISNKKERTGIEDKRKGRIESSESESSSDEDVNKSTEVREKKEGQQKESEEESGDEWIEAPASTKKDDLVAKTANQIGEIRKESMPFGGHHVKKRKNEHLESSGLESGKEEEKLPKEKRYRTGSEGYAERKESPEMSRKIKEKLLEKGLRKKKTRSESATESDSEKSSDEEIEKDEQNVLTEEEKVNTGRGKTESTGKGGLSSSFTEVGELASPKDKQEKKKRLRGMTRKSSSADEAGASGELKVSCNEELASSSKAETGDRSKSEVSEKDDENVQHKEKKKISGVEEENVKDKTGQGKCEERLKSSIGKVDTSDESSSDSSSSSDGSDDERSMIIKQQKKLEVEDSSSGGEELKKSDESESSDDSSSNDEETEKQKSVEKEKEKSEEENEESDTPVGDDGFWKGDYDEMDSDGGGEEDELLNDFCFEPNSAPTEIQYTAERTLTSFTFQSKKEEKMKAKATSERFSSFFGQVETEVNQEEPVPKFLPEKKAQPDDVLSVCDKPVARRVVAVVRSPSPVRVRSPTPDEAQLVPEPEPVVSAAGSVKNMSNDTESATSTVKAIKTVQQAEAAEVDEESSLGESWGSRYVSSEKVQKIVGTSKMLSKVRSKIKEKVAKDSKSGGEDSPMHVVENPVIIGSLEEYQRLKKMEEGSTAAVDENQEEEDEEESALWGEILG